MNKLNLQQTIEQLLTHKKYAATHAALIESYQDLQHTYANLKENIGTNNQTPLLINHTQRMAYILSRMPATFAVAAHLFNETAYFKDSAIKSLLDLGSGSGALLWAALNSPLQLNKITAVDQDQAMLAIAQELAALNQHTFWQSVQWQQSDLTQTIKDYAAHDLLSLSYVLIELDAAQITPLLAQIWPLANQACLIIEPGTPKGFQNILLAREYFIAQGAYIIAPCSHNATCPLQQTWCHFTERMQRSYWQRTLKNAVLGYEDEPYIYLLVSKQPIQPEGQRILSTPSKKSGHIILELCAPEQIKKTTVTRSQKTLYKLAKKKKWGDTWPM